MLNQVVLVGRLVKDPEVKSTSDGKKVSHISLAVSRNFKSTETGKYETDFIYNVVSSNNDGIISACIHITGKSEAYLGV